jgi:peptidoglycan/xylan/chitin deacetylase (PgdA/CDA1 family)
LLQRIYAEGDVIGNHTYSHPDIATASGPRTHLELNLTQRLIEHVLGRSTTLFRPPYQAEIEPDTVDGLRPLENAGADGYIVVPRDWDTRSPAQIERIAMEERDFGNIIASA